MTDYTVMYADKWGDTRPLSRWGSSPEDALRECDLQNAENPRPSVSGFFVYDADDEERGYFAWHDLDEDGKALSNARGGDCMTTTTPIPKRREFFLSDECVIAVGDHNPGDKEKCSGEMLAWVLDIKHTASPPCVSPVLTGFIQRYNDSVDDEARNRLEWKLLCLKALGTAGDGKDELRGWVAADWAVRHATPIWLEIAGAVEAAAALRALPPITDRASYDNAYKVLRPISDDMWGRWAAWRLKARAAVNAELEKRGLEESAALAAAAADALAAAAAAAVALAAAGSSAWPLKRQLVFAERWKPILAEKYAEASGYIDSGLQVFERMLDPEQVSA